MNTIHLVTKVLSKDKMQPHISVVRTACGKTIKQHDIMDNVNCPRCLAVQFPSNETTIDGGNTFTCFYCAKTVPDKEHETDHKIPRSRGGRDILANMVDSCRRCNRAKGDMTAQEFLRTFK